MRIVIVPGCHDKPRSDATPVIPTSTAVPLTTAAASATKLSSIAAMMYCTGVQPDGADAYAPGWPARSVCSS